MSNMSIKYTVKITIINSITNESVIFNKAFVSDLTVNSDNLLYDNNHIIHDSVYVLDLFTDEVTDYCEIAEITTDKIIIDEYELYTETERVEVYFENVNDPETFTLSPSIKCYVYPKEEPLKVPELIGTAYDSNTIVWTWPDDEDYAHYLITEPLDESEDSTSEKIIATIPIGAKQYIESGLEPDTPYSRRLINFTATQTSLPSGQVTVMTETVNPSYSLSEYFINREQDWTITDEERSFIKEHLETFHSGVGDLNDCKVYKQSDKDFYEKFKGYFVLYGTYTKRERRWDQVSFRYKIKLEAVETIQEQEGDITFKLDVYPWQDVYLNEYLWTTHSIDVYARLRASIQVFKTTDSVYEDTIIGEYNEDTPSVPDTGYHPLMAIIVVDVSSSMRAIVNGTTVGASGEQRMDYAKIGAKTCVNVLEGLGDNKPDGYVITVFGDTAESQYAHNGAQAIALIDSMYCGQTGRGDGGMSGHTVGNSTNWYAGMNDCKNSVWDNAFASANNGQMPQYKSMVFLTDGSPNEPYGVGAPANYTSLNTDGLDFLYTIVICNRGTDGLVYTSDPDTSETPVFVTNAVEYLKVLSNNNHTETNNGEGISNAFATAAEVMTRFNNGSGGSSTPVDPPLHATVTVPVTSINTKIINLQTELLKFTFNGTNTPVVYNPITKRAEIYRTLPNTIMPLNAGGYKTVKQMLEEALAVELAKPENDGYTTGNVKDGNGNIIGKVWKNLHVLDTYSYSSEDTVTSLDFSSNWQYGNYGTINTFTNADGVLTVTNADDTYIVTDNSYVWINGFSEGIIYDGIRYGHASVCAYEKCIPQTTIFFRQDIPNLLTNRLVDSIRYSSVMDNNHFDNYINSTNIKKEVILYKTPDPNYTQLTNNGIDKDMLVSIKQYFESPTLTYRFNILDPHAYTYYYEILDTCNQSSTDLNCIVITVYKANNVCVNPTSANYNYISSFDCENPVQNPLLFEYGLNSTWDAASGIYNCDGQYINQYLHYYTLPMLKTQNYYDELPPEGQELYYGQVNGRYRENNPTGKQDLIVNTPQFDIPTTVLATHSDTVKIYLEIEETSPVNALVEYKWLNENPLGSGYTNINGDYVTFTSDAITIKDIEYKDIISTIQTENMELFDQSPYEVIKQINRPLSPLEDTYVKEYDYNSTINWQTNCISYRTTGIEILPVGQILGPYEDCRTGRYKLTLLGLYLSNAVITISDREGINIPYQYDSNSDTSIIIKFDLYERHDDVCIRIYNDSLVSVLITKYTFGRISGYYEHYYVEASTNNGDVIVSKCPYEIIFDDNNQYELPVTYQGIINATSRWAPRVHNGYYYFNQHENYLYSEFDIEANFAQETITDYKTDTLFIIFDVTLNKDGGETETYTVNKDTKAELLQNETHFRWVDRTENPLNYGLTLKATTEGFSYAHYNAYTWESPVISFPNILTTAGTLTVTYRNTDGSNTGLEFKVRSYDVENACWPDWSEAVSFTNGTYPNVPLSTGYQIQCILSATEQHDKYEYEQYLSCYLDWCDYIDDNVSFNINTATDHITVGPLTGTTGTAVSKILDFACGTGVGFSIYASDSTVGIQVAYSNNRNDLLMENAIWRTVDNTVDLSYRYWRFKIVMPYGSKVYWLKLNVNTLKSTVTLPYILSVHMTGIYEPEDITTTFQDLESFEVPMDGQPHEIISDISYYIESDIVSKGFTLNDISKLNITTTNEDAYLIFNDSLLLDNPDPALLTTSINAAYDEGKIETLTNTPYILTNESNQIVITGTPQQYCPITVETVDGTTLKEIYNASESDMKLYEQYIMTEENNYITLKRTDFETNTLQVWINDDEVLDFEIINHLIMFKNNYMPNDVISVSYNIQNSFLAKIDRDNNQTIIVPYENTTIWNNGQTKQYKVMFETSLTNNKFKTDLSMNPTYRTEYSGFVYMTYEHNVPYSINVFCNPRRIKSGGIDSVDINIEVLDVLKNPVIAKEVAVDCLYGTIICNNYITDENGVVHLIYQACYNACIDTITAKVLLEDETNLENSIQITNY